MAMLAGPLNKLLRKDVKWCWRSLKEDSFNDLKRAVTTAPVLCIPDTTRSFTVQVDASNTAIGAVLLQNKHSIGFMSRRLTDAE